MHNNDHDMLYVHMTAAEAANPQNHVWNIDFRPYHVVSRRTKDTHEDGPPRGVRRPPDDPIFDRTHFSNNGTNW